MLKPLETFINCNKELQAATQKYQNQQINYMAWITEQENSFQRYGYTRETFDKELTERKIGPVSVAPPPAKPKAKPKRAVKKKV